MKALTKSRIASACLLVGIAFAGCRNLPGPIEITDDGLQRMASRAGGGVFRAPGAPFTQYTKIMLEPLLVSYVENWQKKYENMRAGEPKRIREEAQKIFREEFSREIIKRGNYSYADAPGPDVLMISPELMDFDIVPENADADMQTSTPGPPKMRLTSELRDAATGKLVGRIEMFSGTDRYPFNQLRPANRATNGHEQRVAYARYAALIREALNVAKTEKPRPPPPPAPPAN